MSMSHALVNQSRVGLSKLVMALAIAVALAACSNSKKETAAEVTADQSSSAKIVQVGAEKMQHFLSFAQADAIKNMLGGARAVFIAPYIQGEAALIGMENGTGYLMCRHGQDWSDPVFYKITQYSVGYQGGAKEEHMVMLFMTDKAVSDFTKGKMDLAGSGGFALGTIGAGASGAGGIQGGLELLIVSTDEGAYLGSGMGTMTPQPATAINDAIYGPNVNPTAILADTGGKYPPADAVRATLSKWVAQAWDVSAR